ncbi:hypothetical protein FRC12_008073 [Ceratobasidium sp. 428]|nr:hypothetical protein FRC12_008073 [Ceratobasidium sp. 428]
MDLDISYLYDSLTVNDILELLKNCPLDRQPKAVINTLLRRNKKRLIQTLVEEGQYWANTLYEAATHKANESRHKQKERQDRDVENARTTRFEHQESRSTVNFMELPSEREFMERYTETHEATTNLALKETTCAVCARLLNVISAKVTRMWFEDLPNRQRLRPSVPHREHYLIDGCLLEEEGCRQTGDRITVNVCQECWDALTEETNHPPKFSLANNMWIGPVPWQLLCLTLAEQLLVARVYPRVFIVKLFPRDKSRFGLNNDQLQSALRGNVTSFELNSDAIADMIKGNLMPQRPAILASVLSVTFIGKGKVLNPAALQMFCVRRVMVGDALLWLKNNNQKYYGDIDIQSSRLEELPPNGVPEVITINIRYEEDDTMIGAELGGYVPDSYIDDNADVEGQYRVTGKWIIFQYNNVFFHLVLAPTGCPDDGAPDDASVVPIQCLGVMDNDLSKISLNELTSWGLQNMQRRDVNSRSEWGYAVRYGAPVNTFGQPPKNQPPADPNRRNYWEAAFAVLLYPHGVGGIESDRPVCVSFIEHV